MMRKWFPLASLVCLCTCGLITAQVVASSPGAGGPTTIPRGIAVAPNADDGDPDGGAGPPDRCDPLTIARGEFSGIGWDDPGFKGAQCVIRRPEAWGAFWHRHTSLLEDPPPPPPVDFEHWTVLAVVQGMQSSGGGPHVEIVGLAHRPACTTVIVIDDERPGDLDVITNPFHIVQVRNCCIRAFGCFCFEMREPEPEPGAIVGHVFGITPDGGEIPLGGALVRLFAGPGIVRETLTNDDGAYGFEEVRPGEYGMEAWAEGFAPAEAFVMVEPGEVTVQDFLLEHAPPPGAIVGHVFGITPDGGEIPLGGALVRLFAGPGIVRETLTNDEGAYAFEEVRPGEYGMEARAEGFAPAEAFVMVEPGEVTVQDFLLEHAPPPGAIVGHVFGMTPEGDEIPLPGALVRLFSNSDPDMARETLTNDDGVYAFENVAPGHHGMLALAEGFAPGAAFVMVEPGGVTHQNFLLEPAAGGAWNNDPDTVPTASGLGTTQTPW